MSTQANRITAALFSTAGFENNGTTNRPRFYYIDEDRTGRAVRVEKRDGGGYWVGLYNRASVLTWDAELGPLHGSALLMSVGLFMHAQGIELADEVGEALRQLVVASEAAALAVVPA